MNSKRALETRIYEDIKTRSYRNKSIGKRIISAWLKLFGYLFLIVCNVVIAIYICFQFETAAIMPFIAINILLFRYFKKLPRRSLVLKRITRRKKAHKERMVIVRAERKAKLEEAEKLALQLETEEAEKLKSSAAEYIQEMDIDIAKKAKERFQAKFSRDARRQIVRPKIKRKVQPKKPTRTTSNLGGMLDF